MDPDFAFRPLKRIAKHPINRVAELLPRPVSAELQTGIRPGAYVFCHPNPKATCSTPILRVLLEQWRMAASMSRRGNTWDKLP
jgi:hypothetical protein